MKLNKIASLLLGAVIAVGAVSCEDDKYEPTPAYTGNEVYFDKDMSTTVTIPLDATSVPVEIYRVKSSSELMVDLVSTVTTADGTDASNIISVPATVTFAQDATSAQIPVSVNFPAVVADEDYIVNISVKGENLTPYGETSVTLSMSYAPWSEWENPTGTAAYEVVAVQMAGLWDYAYDAPMLVRQSLTNENLIQYFVPFPFQDVDFGFTLSMDMSKKVELEGEEVIPFTMERIDTGIANGSTGKYFSLWDTFSFAKALFPDMTEEQIYAFCVQKMGGFSYYSPARGLFAVNQIVFPTEDPVTGSYYTTDYNYIQRPGFKQYTLDFTKVYNLVDEMGNESVVIEAYKSEDVATFSYTITPGVMTDAEISAEADAIVADGEATLYSDQLTYLAYTPEEAGDYTLVGVGFDADAHEVIRKSYVFTYESVQKASEWHSIGEGALTDGIVCGIYNVQPVTWDVEIEEHNTTPGLYRVVNPYLNWPYNVANQGALVKKGNYYLEIDATDPDAVRVNHTEIGVQMNAADGFVSVWNYGDILINMGRATFDQCKKAGYFGKLVDGSVEIPTGRLAADLSSDPMNWFLVNCDPNNPAYSDPNVQFDPTWGQGTFYLTIYSLEEAAQAPARKSIASPSSLSVDGAMLRGKAVLRSPKMSNSVSSSSLNDARFGKVNYLR